MLPISPKLAEIREIIIKDQRKYFITEILEIRNFHSRTNTYNVQNSGNLDIISHNALKFKFPLDVFADLKQICIRYPISSEM